MIKKLLYWCVLAFVAVSCDESYVTPDPEARGLNYYPLEVGQYRIYDVTDIHYQNDVPSEERFQMREWVADSFMDQTNTLTYKIIRSIRPNAQTEWEDDSVIVVTKDQNRVILTSDNTRYVKMVFPVKNGQEWEPDFYNSRKLPDGKREKARYNFVDEPYSLEGKVYDKTVIVTQGEPPLLETKIDVRQEVYARNIGRIYRVFDRRQLQECLMNCDPDNPYELDGHERYEVLVEHGKL